MEQSKDAISLIWGPDLGALTDWIRRWENLVFGRPGAGYVYRESVELRYEFEHFERELDGIADAARVLRRLEGDVVRAVAGVDQLALLGDNGEHGGLYAIHVTPPAQRAGTLRLRGTFAVPADVAAWLDEITMTLFSRPYGATPATNKNYDAPLEISLKGLSRSLAVRTEDRPDARGLGRCDFDSTSVTGQRSFYVNIDYFEQGTRPLLVPQVFQQPTVSTPAQLHDWLAPVVAQLVSPDVGWRIPEGEFPQPLMAQISRVHAGRILVQVGDVGTRWIETSGDLAALFHPEIHSPCHPGEPAELAAWLTTVGQICFGTGAVTWSTNWSGVENPLKLGGHAIRMAEELFAVGHPDAVAVRGVDADIVQVRMDMPNRYVKFAGWVGATSPSLRAAG